MRIELINIALPRFDMKTKLCVFQSLEREKMLLSERISGENTL